MKGKDCLFQPLRFMCFYFDFFHCLLRDIGLFSIYLQDRRDDRLCYRLVEKRSFSSEERPIFESFESE